MLNLKEIICLIGSFPNMLNSEVIVISDGAGWVIDNVSSNISKFVNENGLRSCVIKSSFVSYLKNLKNKRLFFIDRWAYLDLNKKSLFERLSRHNNIILTWWHSGSDNKNIELAQSVDTLKKLSSYLTVIHVPCSQEYNLLVSKGIPEDKIKVVPEGIEVFFKPSTIEKRLKNRKRFNIPQNSFCIGLFQKDGVGWGEGNIPKREKGPDIFVETASRLAKKHKNIFVVLTGPSRGFVKERLKKSGVPFIHKYLNSYENIVDYYSVLDLYLITSRTEGGPKSVLEAMACGVPVVSTKVGMCPDVIKDNDNGFLCDIENVEQLCEKAELLISDSKLRAKFSENGIETAKSYSWPKIAKLFIEKCINVN